MFKKHPIYFDYAATTYTEKEVWQEMKPCFNRFFGNAGSLHRFGREANRIMDKARREIAEVLTANPREIIFTASGTESDNLAILGTARAYSQQGKHLISTQIEHKAVLNPMKQLSKAGFRVDFLPVNNQGLVSVDQLKDKITDETVLVSVIYANNEIGVIEPIQEIGHIIKQVRIDREERKITTPIFFHTDACQAAGYLSLKVDQLGVDLLTLNGSKIYGPKGTGLLYVRSGLKLAPLIFGGDQELGFRPGTENVPGAIGLATALKIAQRKKAEETKRQVKLRDYFIRRLTSEIPRVFLNGDPIRRMPNNINISVLGIEGEAMLLWLDKYGIAASTGSACDSRDLEPSHVILALGRSHEYAHGSLRLSLGRQTTKREIDYFMKVFPKIVSELRKISSIRYE